MIGMRAFRAAFAAAAVSGVVLAAPAAEAAGPYAIDAHIDGPGSGFNYTPGSFRWNEQFEVSFTHLTDTTSAALLGLAKGHTDVPTAVVHETLNSTAVVTLAMTGVRVDAVHEEGSVNNPNGPEETVVLRFRSVTYTYQQVTAAGQKLGPPVTITFSRPGFDPSGR
jgi:type VI protein secretion system component Hcp